MRAILSYAPGAECYVLGAKCFECLVLRAGSTQHPAPSTQHPFLSLPLFVLLIRTDHPYDALAAHDLALVANPFHRRSNFHRILKSWDPQILTASNLLDDPP